MVPRRTPVKALKKQEAEQENSMGEINPIFGLRRGTRAEDLRGRPLFRGRYSSIQSVVLPSQGLIKVATAPVKK